jgi:hypothetical protein
MHVTNPLHFSYYLDELELALLDQEEITDHCITWTLPNFIT